VLDAAIALNPDGAAGAVWLTLRFKIAVAVVDKLSVTVTLTEKVAKVPALKAVVPLITPVAGLIEYPVGKPVAVQLRTPVPPVATTVVL
jgi:hypothetical protein